MSRRLLPTKPRAGVAPRGRHPLRHGEAQRVPARAVGRTDGTPRAAAALRPERPVRCAGHSWRALASDGRAPREPSDLFIESGRWRHGSRTDRKPQSVWMARAVACCRAPFSSRVGYCPIAGCSTRWRLIRHRPCRPGRSVTFSHFAPLHVGKGGAGPRSYRTPVDLKYRPPDGSASSLQATTGPNVQQVGHAAVER